MLSKARRGELIGPLPVGLVYNGADKVVLDPDTGVQQAIRHLFAMFTATGSAHATVKAFAAGKLTFPRRIRTGANKGELAWGQLAHHRVLQVLHNPRYAGAFFFGRHTQRLVAGGKMTTRLLPREEWTALIIDSHPGYITWDDFETNQTRLTELAAAHGLDRKASPPREGPALLQGMAVCGVCGRRMTVRYRTRQGKQAPEYVCQNEGIRTATSICQSIPGADIDATVSQLLLKQLTPLALRAALAVAEELVTRADDADRLRATSVQRAQHHADLTRRRYLAVDPNNRLVADSLEADWNGALRELADTTDAYEQAKKSANGPLTEAQHAKITALATDFPTLWNDPATPMRERKRMIRLLVEDVTLRRGEHITIAVRLRGGQHHQLNLPLPRAAWELRQTPPEVVAAVDDLLEHHCHAQIADILNQRGLASGEGRPFHRLVVRNIRDAYQLRSREQRLRDKGLITLNDIAVHFGIHPTTAKNWHQAGLLTGTPFNDKGERLYQKPGPDFVRPAIGRRSAKPEHPAKTTRGAV